MTRPALLGALLALAACEPEAALPAPAPTAWADLVLSAPGASDAVYGDPALAANGARGGGWFTGSTDVFSLAPGDELVLGWDGRILVDAEGADLVVFENAFALDDGSRFMDPAVVSVSPDGEAWVAFPHAYAAGAAWSADPADWAGFAGVTPTLLHEDANPVDPFDPVAAGGDAFDLADLPPGDVTDRVLDEGAVAVRITPASDELDPATGAPYPTDPVSNGPDVDAVYGRDLVEGR